MNKVKGVFYQFVFYLFRPFVKRRKNRVFFGSWCGELVTDNSFYLAKYFDSYGTLEMYWVGKKEIEALVNSSFRNIKFLDFDRFSTGLKLMGASVVFHSQMLQGDFPRYNVYQKATKIHLFHGLAIKKVYADALHVEKSHPLKKLFGIFMGSGVQDDYYLTSSPVLGKYILSAFRTESPKKLLEFGSPRNDYLIHADGAEKDRVMRKYGSLLNCDLRGKKIILYAPTYRRTASNNISLLLHDGQKNSFLIDFLEKNNCVFLEKKHFVGIKENRSQTISVCPCGFVLDSIEGIDFQELLVIADVLISDYSGAIFDYCLTNKPQVSFVFDYDFYKEKDSGLYFDVEEYSPGDIAYSFEELLSELDFIIKNGFNRRNNLQCVKDRFLSHEKGRCSQRLLEFLVNSGNITAKNE